VRAKSRGQSVVVSNEQRTLRAPAALVRRAASAAIRHAGPVAGAISVVIVSDERMRELNREFARVVGTTDVLAFDLSGGPKDSQGPAGEVVVNADEALRQARRRRKTATDELALYVIHGILHLCGYDDHKAADTRRMRAAERNVMRSLGRRGVATGSDR
jgi:rRNA maturation RNase YbeY